MESKTYGIFYMEWKCEFVQKCIRTCVENNQEKAERANKQKKNDPNN